MRKELDNADMELVAGGNYYINKNNLKVAFTTIKGQAFQLHGCTANEAMDVMDSLIGVYPTVAEYDRACVAEFERLGWI